MIEALLAAAFAISLALVIAERNDIRFMSLRAYRFSQLRQKVIQRTPGSAPYSTRLLDAMLYAGREHIDKLSDELWDPWFESLRLRPPL